MPDYLDRSEEMKIEIVDHLPNQEIITEGRKIADMSCISEPDGLSS